MYRRMDAHYNLNLPFKGLFSYIFGSCAFSFWSSSFSILFLNHFCLIIHHDEDDNYIFFLIYESWK